jgi:hypothetical protein
MLLTRLPVNCLNRIVFYLKDARDIISLMLTCKIFNLHEIDYLTGFPAFPSGQHIPLRYFAMIHHLRWFASRYVVSKHFESYERLMKTMAVNIRRPINDEGNVFIENDEIHGDLVAFGDDGILGWEICNDEFQFGTEEEVVEISWNVCKALRHVWKVSEREFGARHLNRTLQRPFISYEEPYVDKDVDKFLEDMVSDLKGVCGQTYKFISASQKENEDSEYQNICITFSNKERQVQEESSSDESEDERDYSE